MKKLLLALAVLAAGCANQQQPVTPVLNAETIPNRDQTDARTRAELHTQLGAGYFELRNYRVALEELQEALRTDPGYGPAHNMLALVYMELREDALAQQSFERALQINPLDSDANNNYGWFLCQRKRYDDAAKYYLAALKNPLYPTPEKAYVNLGLCARERGDLAGAAQHFERARSLQPGNPVALYHLSEMAFRRGQPAEARGFLADLAKTGAPFNAESLWLALRIERALGNRDAEASYGLQLRRNFPNSRETQALVNRQFE